MMSATEFRLIQSINTKLGKIAAALERVAKTMEKERHAIPDSFEEWWKSLKPGDEYTAAELADEEYMRDRYEIYLEEQEEQR